MKKTANPRAAQRAKADPVPRGPLPQQPFTVVGFGASAGGLEAFTEVLHHLPPDLGMALVFIQHLDPRHGSILTDLLSRSTSMPVHQVTDGMTVEPNHVYVIPPNANLVVSDGALHLEARQAGPNMPIDGFFRSLAESHGGKAIGVVLSGTASDGTLGLMAIKAAGGITMAQDPESARYDGMPRNAINSGCVDFVLLPEAVAQEIVDLRQHPYLRHPVPEDAAPATDDQAMKEIFNQLKSTTGVDFSLYKPGTIRRRVLRRMALQKIDNLERYAAYVKQNKGELSLLFQDMLINVTSFFREPVTFEALRARVFPGFFENRPPEQPIRVWVPGCATGEETYSITICLIEYMRQAGKESPLQVFGTDLSESALEKARAGIYPEDIAADVSTDRLRRFFTRVNSSYQIARAVRDNCIFARQNVTKDPPFSKLDLILCRNVLIYLGPSLQSAAMRLFHYALQPHGYLVLGLSESVGPSSDLFDLVDKKVRIYSRRPVPVSIATDLGGYQERADGAPSRHLPAPSGLNVHRKVDQMLLARYSPPAVVIDKALRILEFRGRTAAFLEHTVGEASLNLLKMSPTSIGVEVQKLLRKVDDSGVTVKSKPLSISVKGGVHSVVVSISSIHVEGMEPQYLVIIEELRAGRERRPPAGPQLPPKASALGERVKELEQELIATKESLQSVIEEQEAGTEELKSANEEVQSSNEELQSTNEELLTAKEELQSTNEELTTVNEEMHGRNAELQQINNDLLNLLNSVNVPTVMLDNDLKIRRFTAQAEKLFSLLSTDIGRPISDLRLKLNVPDVVALCHEVLDHLTPKEREVQDTEGNTYSMWVRPYRTIENRIEGVVLSLFDISGRRQAAEVRYHRLFEAATDGIVIADAITGDILDVNPYITRLSGYPRSRLVGEKLWETPLFRDTPIDDKFVARCAENESSQQSGTIAAVDGRQVEVDVVCGVYAEGERRVAQFNIRDVSARKRSEEERRRGEEEGRQAQKMEAVGRLAGGVAHDFNNLLTAVLGYCELLDQELQPGHPGRKMVSNIRMAGERAALLTKQLLAFGRKEVVRLTVLNVNDMIVGVRQLLEVMLDKGVELALQLQPRPEVVRADRNELEQVILNLVLNARDAMPKGGRITVQTGHVSIREGEEDAQPPIPPGDYVTISVKDTGKGMDEQTQTRVFEPFFTTKGEGEGVGLGLSTVYNIVRQAGGFINVSSALGLGTTFSIYLPKLSESELAKPSEPERAQPAGGTETILLLDDDAAIRTLAARSLEQMGYKVLEAPSGPEAIRVSDDYEGPIHLLLTDVVMPNMSGREVAFQLAPKRPDMRVLYISGHTEERIAHHGVLQDRMAFLQKPFTLSSLTAKVRDVLDRPKDAGPAPSQGRP